MSEFIKFITQKLSDFKYVQFILCQLYHNKALFIFFFNEINTKGNQEHLKVILQEDELIKHTSGEIDQLTSHVLHHENQRHIAPCYLRRRMF